MTREDEAKSRLMAFVCDQPEWELPQPRAAITIETAVAFAMTYATERADAEAAAMRERAAMCADIFADPSDTPSDFISGFENAARKLARRIRSLPTTEEQDGNR